MLHANEQRRFFPPGLAGGVLFLFLPAAAAGAAPSSANGSIEALNGAWEVDVDATADPAKNPALFKRIE